MQRFISLLTLPLMMAACSRPPQYIAPAPEGALECAVSHALDMGYRRMEGEAEAGVVRVSQRVDPLTQLPAVAEPTPATGERLEPEEDQRKDENHLIFRQEGGRLHIQIVSIAEDRPTKMPAPAADEHARRILAACTTP